MYKRRLKDALKTENAMDCERYERVWFKKNPNTALRITFDFLKIVNIKSEFKKSIHVRDCLENDYGPK